MPTGNGLIDRAALEVNRTDDLGSAGTNVAQAKAYLDDAIRTLVNRHDFTWRIAPTVLSVACVVTSPPTVLYDASAGAGGVKIQDIAGIVLDTAASDTAPMEEISLGRYRRDWANVLYESNSKPTHYARVGKYSFLVAPPPQSASYSFKITYWPEYVAIPDFTKDLFDPALLPGSFFAPRAEEAIYLGLLMRMYRYTHDWTSAAGVAAQAEAEIQAVIKDDREKPNLLYTMQPFVAAGAVPTSKYWANPWSRTQE